MKRFLAGLTVGAVAGVFAGVVFGLAQTPEHPPSQREPAREAVGELRDE